MLALSHLLQSRGLIVNHGVGTGKTKLAVAFAVTMYLLLYGNIMFLCPKSLKDNMKKEVESMVDGYANADHIKSSFKYFGFKEYISNVQRADARYAADVSNERTLRRQAKAESWSKQKTQKDIHPARHTFPPLNEQILVIDEAHALKAAGTERYAFISSCAKRAHKVLLLTATPIVNSPYDLAPLVAMVDGQHPVSEDFFDSMTAAQTRVWLTNKVSVHQPSSDERSHFPAQHDHEQEFDMAKDPEYYTSYLHMQKKEFDNLKTGGFDITKNLSVFMNGLRRAANNLKGENGQKIDWIMDRLRTGKGMIRGKGARPPQTLAGKPAKAEPVDKFVIFSSFRAAGIELVQRRCNVEKLEWREVNGSLSEAKRKGAVKDFNDGVVRVLFITKAGGEGLDLKGCTNIILMEPSWTLADELQVIGRAVRYNSHITLPLAMQRVDVWRLYSVKPPPALRPYDDRDKNGDFMESVDTVIKQRMAAKQVEINAYMDTVKECSIEAVARRKKKH